jgi:hypothetical protein
MAKEKPEAPPAAITVEIDERWVGEWVDFGFVAISIYLGHYTAFAEYLDRKDAA